MQMQNYTKIKTLEEKMAEAIAPKAIDVSYDNTQSHIDAANIQAAIDKLASADMDIMTSIDRLALSNDRIDTLLGDTDISDIGDGTVTGAVSQIDDNLSDLVTYSTNEVDTGKKWVDGKTIYRKVVNIGALPNSTTKKVDHGVSGIDTIVKIYGTANSNNNALNLPYVETKTNNVNNIPVYVSKVAPLNITVITEVDFSTYTGVIIIEYTKV